MTVRHFLFQAPPLSVIAVPQPAVHGACLEHERRGGQPAAAHLHQQVAAFPIEPGRAPRQTSAGGHVLQVISVPANPLVYGQGARDSYVVCGCGWASLPFIGPRSVSRLSCDACDERADGQRNFRVLVADAAAAGYRVEVA